MSDWKYFLSFLFLVASAKGSNNDLDRDITAKMFKKIDTMLMHFGNFHNELANRYQICSKSSRGTNNQAAKLLESIKHHLEFLQNNIDTSCPSEKPAHTSSTEPSFTEPDSTTSYDPRHNNSNCFVVWQDMVNRMGAVETVKMLNCTTFGRNNETSILYPMPKNDRQTTEEPNLTESDTQTTEVPNSTHQPAEDPCASCQTCNANPHPPGAPIFGWFFPAQQPLGAYMVAGGGNHNPVPLPTSTFFPGYPVSPNQHPVPSAGGIYYVNPSPSEPTHLAAGHPQK